MFYNYLLKKNSKLILKENFNLISVEIMIFINSINVKLIMQISNNKKVLESFNLRSGNKT